MKNFRENSVFRASASSSKILISMQWNFSGQTQFFKASGSCSKLLSIKNTFNTVNSGTLCFSGQAKVAETPECKNYIKYSEKFHDKLCFQGKRKFLKNPENKNISMQWKFSGQTLFLRACASCSKFRVIKNIYIQYSEFRAHSVFQGKLQVAQKSWKIKNI